MEDLIVLTIPKSFSHTSLENFLPNCREGILEYLDNWAIISITNYVQNYSLFRIPNECQKWICVAKPGIISNFTGNSEFNRQILHEKFIQDEAVWQDFNTALIGFFSDVERFSSSLLVNKLGEYIGRLEEFAELIAQELWDELRNREKPVFDICDYVAAEVIEKGSFVSDWDKMNSKWKEFYPREAPKEFICQLSDIWLKEKTHAPKY
jgi:hypothetical protein